MRGFIVLCLVAAVCADKLGYNYRPVGHSTAGLSFTPGGGNIGGGVAPVHTEYNKEYYTFSAPEHAFDDPQAAQKLAGAIKKNIRVIFIKAPENRALENAALALAKQAAEQKTAIYVLHKQPDIAGLADKFNAIRNNNRHKPEVHFVKYRTPEDAANAQRSIQSQYDALGGPSQSHNGGVAPVLNFASPSSANVAPQIQSPDSAYLPAGLRHRLRA